MSHITADGRSVLVSKYLALLYDGPLEPSVDLVGLSAVWNLQLSRLFTHARANALVPHKKHSVSITNSVRLVMFTEVNTLMWPVIHSLT